MGKQQFTVAEIKKMLFEDVCNPTEAELLRTDERAAVKRLLKKWEKQQQDRKRVRALYQYEDEFHAQGKKVVAGIDEAGRGPLAGPVVVAAVILPRGCYLSGINDSKKLSPKQRERLYDEIQEAAVAVERAVIDRETIDRVNIYQATIQGMQEVIQKLMPPPEAVLIDAVPLELLIPSLSLIKGDALSASIAAASIIAKVERDRMMENLDREYPKYGFAKHKGYGTAEHLAAIRKYGPCPQHRRTFEPIKSWGRDLRGNE